MPTLISVDYDFFIPHGMFEESIYLPAVKTAEHGSLVFDWQMEEGRGAILDLVVWQTRCANFRRWGLDIEAMTRPKLAVEDFMIEVSTRCGGSYVPAWYADSHAWGAIVARDLSEQYGPLDVVNFDAHHDLGYTQGYEKIDDKVDCGNWALAGLQHGHISNYTVVYPDWLGTVELHPERLKLLQPVSDRISITTYSEWVKTAEIEDLEAGFLCRSSAWSPPWLDAGFQTLLDEWGYCECLDCRYGQMCSGYNACQPREWDWDSVWKYADEREAHFQMLLTGAVKLG